MLCGHLLHLLIIYTKPVHTYSRQEPVSEGMITQRKEATHSEVNLYKVNVIMWEVKML